MRTTFTLQTVALACRRLRNLKSPISLAAVILASPAQAAFVSAPSSEAYENEPFLRFRVERDGDTNLVQRVDYFTQDVTALAGMHYVAVTGTVIFAVGQTAANIDVPLLDNGLVDSEKRFRLVLTNAGPSLTIYPEPHTKLTGCESYQLGIIKDNELPPTTLESSFAPDAFGWLEMPDGRLLAAQAYDTIMLHPNGWVDASFVPGGGSMDGRYLPTYVFGDGKILAKYSPSYRYEWRYVRLFPNGAVDKVFDQLPAEAYFQMAQPDEKLLMSRNVGEQSLLFRVNADGSLDGSFPQGTFSGGLRKVIVLADGKILVGGSFGHFNGVERRGLVRLNPDGLLDNSFAPFTNAVDLVVVRANGKIIVNGQTQLNPDGTSDPSFSPAMPCKILCEQQGGRLLASVGYAGDPNQRNPGWRLIRLNGDGSLDPSFSATFTHECTQVGIAGPSAKLTSSGILVAGYFDRVDGFPRNGNAPVRLLDHHQQPDFRVFTPPSADRSAGSVVIRVVRTGDTTAAASVDYSTVDDTAKAGSDYVPQSGTLHFAPLEVGKEFAVSLLASTQIVGRLRFNLAWSNPSEGYTNTAPTPVVIWPDLLLGTEQLLSANKLRLHGTIPGFHYRLISSADLNRWIGAPNKKANSTTLDFDASTLNVYAFTSGPSPRFYRAARTGLSP